MQRIVCLTPRAVGLVDVLLGLGVIDAVGAEVVVKALRLASVVLWLLGLSVIVLITEETLRLSVAEFVPDGMLRLSVAVFVPEEMPELLVTEFTPKELLALSVAVSALEETIGLIEEPEVDADPVTMMEAVTVSVTVTAGQVLSVPCAVVKAASREKIKAAMRRDIDDLDIILAVITSD